MPFSTSLAAFIGLCLCSGFLQAQTFTQATRVDGGIIEDSAYNTRNGQEGWVLYNYVINKSGGVEDIIVVDSSDDERITSGGLRQINSFVYEPATLNGINVASHSSFLFRLLESRGGKDRTSVSLGYKAKYDDILATLYAKDFEQAQQKINALDNSGTRLLFEHARTAWLKSMLYFNTQQFDLYTRELQVITLLKDYMPTKSIAGGMSSLFESYLFFNELGKALELVAQMKEFDAVKVSPEVLNTLLEKIAKKSLSEDVITVDATILNAGVYHHVTLGEKIELTTVAGALGSYDLRCQNFRKTGESINQLVLDLSGATSPSCDLFVMGEPGSRFTLRYLQ